jgi:hypothetical protein
VRDDIKAALRSLRASRSFTTIALTVLGLGIGAGRAILSVVDAVVLRGLPFDEHDRLAAVYEKDTKRATTFGEGSITAQTYLDWRQLRSHFRRCRGATDQRDRRMALGATRGSVVAMVMRRAAALVSAGLLIGGVGAWYFTASVKTFLFDVRPNDLGIFAGALAVLAAAGLLASAIPARRAASVDPLVALRSE